MNRLEKSLRYSVYADGELKIDGRAMFEVEKRLLGLFRELEHSKDVSIHLSPDLFEALLLSCAVTGGIDSTGRNHMRERRNVMLNEQVLLFYDHKIPVEFVESQREPVCIASDDPMIVF